MLLDRYEKRKALMTSRAIWILNFVTTALSLSILAYGLSERIDLSESERDIIVLYLVIVIGLYIALLVYLFYYRIYRWGMKSRSPYYIATLLTAIICLIILFQVMVTSGGNFTTRKVVVLIFCAVNVTTYFWGLYRSRTAE